MVALNGLGPVASIIKFQSADLVFDYVVKREVPSVDTFKKFQNTSEFEKLTCKDNNDKIFRKLVVLPPCQWLSYQFPLVNLVTSHV